jgi:uncharacterized pyridoxal phosphate-containing UPF0001 family protein
MNNLADIKVLRNNYEQIQKKVIETAIKCNRNPAEIKILSVSKTHNYEIIAQAIQAGIPIFAESYAQEFRDKNKNLTKVVFTWKG